MEVRQLRDGEVFLPKRKAETHKGDYGKLLVLGGCVGFTGAPCLCAHAAVRSGAGLVYLGVPRDIYEITAVKNDEAMPFPLPADSRGGFDETAADALDEWLKKADVCAVGPGMGKGNGAAAVLERVLREFGGPLVLDADALNLLPGKTALLKARHAPTVLTPHDGEFARLGGVMGRDRAETAQKYAQAWGCILVLKGHRTVIAFPDGKAYITTHGNPGMAKGGSGDVLTGVLGAMLGQLPAEQAVTTGVYLHSYAGDLCGEQLGEYGMTASDLIAMLPLAAKNITAKE